MPFKKVLVYIEPWIENAKPGWKQDYIWWFGEITNALQSQSSGSFEAKLMIGDDCAGFWDLHNNTGTSPAVLSQKELRAVFKNSKTALTSWLKNSYSPEQSDMMCRLIKEKLGTFTPDLILTLTPCPFLRTLYPNALILSRDAMYCREPWPDEMTCVDPFGIYTESAIKKFSNQLLALKNTVNSDLFYTKLKQEFLDPVLDETPFKDTIHSLRSRFSKLLLLPLQSSGYYNFYSATEYNDQYEYLTEVLDGVPIDIGVIVTQHPDDRTLTPSSIEYLTKTYENFVYIPEALHYHAPSQLILPLVDGLVCVSTGLFYQALLWNKAIFTLGSTHFEPYSLSKKLTNISKILSSPQTTNTGMIYWLFTRYFFSYAYLKNEVWLANHLRGIWTNIKNGKIGLDTFPEIDTPEQILENLTATKRITLMRKPAPTIGGDPELSSEIQRLKALIAEQQNSIAHLKKIISEKDEFMTNLHRYNITLEEKLKQNL